jgi:hypothetical protein
MTPVDLAVHDITQVLESCRSNAPSSAESRMPCGARRRRTVGATVFPSRALQNPHDRHYCVPIPCRRRRTEEFVDLAKIADCLHVTTVLSEDESVLRGDNSHEPAWAWWNCDWNGSPDAAGVRHNTHESHSIGACRLTSKRILDLQANKITGVAEHNFRFEWQPPEQFSTELCPRSGFTNDQRACSTHIDDIIVAQFSCEDAWAKRPVAANIDTSEKNNESHAGIIRARCATVVIASSMTVHNARSIVPSAAKRPWRLRGVPTSKIAASKGPD